MIRQITIAALFTVGLGLSMADAGHGFVRQSSFYAPYSPAVVYYQPAVSYYRPAVYYPSFAYRPAVVVQRPVYVAQPVTYAEPVIVETPATTGPPLPAPTIAARPVATDPCCTPQPIAVPQVYTSSYYPTYAAPGYTSVRYRGPLWPFGHRDKLRYRVDTPYGTHKYTYRTNWWNGTTRFEYDFDD